MCAARIELGAANLIDGQPSTSWATDDRVLTADAVFDFGRAVTFSVIVVKEDIRFGQRIDAFAVDRWNGGNWEQVASGTSIGPRRFLRLAQPVTSRAPAVARDSGLGQPGAEPAFIVCRTFRCGTLATTLVWLRSS